MAPVFPDFKTSGGEEAGVIAPFAMPLAVPVGIPSWELTTILPQDQMETQRVPLKFSTPFVLTGLLPSIVYLDSDGLPRELSAQHFWVTLDVDKKLYFTIDGTQTTNNAPGTNWVTLEAASVLVRLYNLHLKGATPEIGAKFRSKFGTPGNSGLPAEMRICLTAFGYECDSFGNKLPLVR